MWLRCIRIRTYIAQNTDPVQRKHLIHKSLCRDIHIRNTELSRFFPFCFLKCTTHYAGELNILISLCMGSIEILLCHLYPPIRWLTGPPHPHQNISQSNHFSYNMTFEKQTDRENGYGAH